MEDAVQELKEAKLTIAAQSDLLKQSATKMESLIDAISSLKQELPFPKNMQPELSEILGMNDSRLEQIGGMYYQAGVKIKKLPDSLRAFALHRCLFLFLSHGSGWKLLMKNELDTLIANSPRIVVPAGNLA